MPRAGRRHLIDLAIRLRLLTPTWRCRHAGTPSRHMTTRGIFAACFRRLGAVPKAGCADSADEEGDLGHRVPDAGLEEAVVGTGQREDVGGCHLDAAVGGVVVDLRVLPAADLVAGGVGALTVPRAGLG